MLSVNFKKMGSGSFSLLMTLVFGVNIATCLTACQRGGMFYHPDEDRGNDLTDRYYDEKASAQSSINRMENTGQPKRRITVFNFANDSPEKHEGFGDYAADELRRGFFLTRRVMFPEANRTDLNTQDYVQGDQIRVAQLIQEGRKIGAGVVVVGRISKVVFRQRGDEIGIFRQNHSLAGVQLEVKVFDVHAGRELLATVRVGESTDHSLIALEGNRLSDPEFRSELIRGAIRQAVGSLVPELMRAIEKTVWQGRVVKMVGQRAYINAGKLSGLMGGDILKVTRPGEDLFDPQTGAFLGRTVGETKGTLEIVDFLPGSDAAIAQVHTGGNFKEGDLVQLY